MLDVIFKYYLWLKVIHIVAVIAWMAGLFYLPRLFVYHVEYPENSRMLEIMESRLFVVIMQPAMFLTVFSGIVLLFVSGSIVGTWIHAKLTCVFLLIVFHCFLSRWKKQLKLGYCSKSSKFFRVINEIPTVLLIFIVIFLIIKPF